MKTAFLENYTVSVKASSVMDDVEKVLVQYHQFPGTISVVAHASLDGFELAVATSPCVDPRNFRSSIGIHYSNKKVMPLAIEKIWEIHGIRLKSLLDNRTESESEFYEKYKDIYVFNPIEEPPVYKEASAPAA